jgi:hypothetical protein
MVYFRFTLSLNPNLLFYTNPHMRADSASEGIVLPGKGAVKRLVWKTGTGAPLPVPFSAERVVVPRKRGQPASGSPPPSA